MGSRVLKGCTVLKVNLLGFWEGEKRVKLGFGEEDEGEEEKSRIVTFRFYSPCFFNG